MRAIAPVEPSWQLQPMSTTIDVELAHGRSFHHEFETLSLADPSRVTDLIVPDQPKEFIAESTTDFRALSELVGGGYTATIVDAIR